MFARLRSAGFAIKASYWFYPAIFSVALFALAHFMVALDRSGAADFVTRLTFLHPARPDGASNMLTVLAGSMIGVASTVFSITIAAVAYASGTYGPRLLTNFMEDKGNQLSLATFIGTFVYSISVLRTVRAEDEVSLFADKADALPGFVPQLALLVGFGLMMIAIAVLVYFLHHIPSSIRINTVLEEIARALLRMIDDRYDEQSGFEAPRRDVPRGADVDSSGTGYIRYIDFGSLDSIAEERETRIGLAVRTGDFVQKGTRLVYLDGDEASEDVSGDIRDCFALGGSRTPEQDIEFAIDELVEIALRALSPGINDPFTAITAIHWLGAATARLGKKQLHPDGDGDKILGKRVIPLEDDFAHFLKRGFGMARGAVASSKPAALVCLDTLAEVARLLPDRTRAALVEREAALLLTQSQIALAGPELDEVRARHALRFAAQGD
ncbi:MAG: DUF2254 domain-containing protein [Novosphingobium sp.]|nr:DUF2254 domain-containing protein [Novosphingobium sp.]